MIKDYQHWKLLDGDISLKEYEFIKHKLDHVGSYIREYLAVEKSNVDALLENLELDATASYFIEPSDVDLAPWVFHKTVTFEIRSSDISSEISAQLEPLVEVIQYDDISLSINRIAKAIVYCLDRLTLFDSRSADLLFVYAVDVGLAKLISITTQLRLKKLISNP